MLKTDKERWRIQQQLKVAQQPIRVESKPEAVKNRLVGVTTEESSSLDSITTNETCVTKPEEDIDLLMTENVQSQADFPVQLDIKDDVESVTSKYSAEEPVAVITMAPVTSMSGISTKERIAIEKQSLMKFQQRLS